MKTNRLISFLVVFVFTCGVLLAAMLVQASATVAGETKQVQQIHTDTETGLQYTITDGEITIVGYEGTSGNLTIPSEINGTPVKAIGRSAFHSCEILTDVEIEEGIVSIGAYAFQNCSALKRVELPDGIDTIEKYTFSNCRLEHIRLPADLKTVGEFAISGAELTELILPETLITIDKYAFFVCSGLKSVYIPKNVETIGQSAFSHYVVLYCFVTERPEGWHEKWVDDDTEVHWGYCQHRNTETFTVAPTCTTEGSTLVKCYECNNDIQFELIPKLDHIGKTVTQNATCTQTGMSVTTCMMCGSELSKEILPLLQHSDTVLSAEPTCDTAGYKKTVCTECNRVSSEQTYLAIGHQFVGKTCSVCGFEPQVSSASGDANGDGKIGAQDYMMLKRYVLGTYKIADRYLAQVDISGDGKIRAQDYMMLKRAVLGTYTLKPVCDHEEFAVAGVPATCVEAGKTQGTMCRLCGTVLSGWDPIEKSNHKLKGKVCTLCGKSFDAYTALSYHILANADGQIKGEPVIYWLAETISDTDYSATLLFLLHLDTGEIELNMSFVTSTFDQLVRIHIPSDSDFCQVSTLYQAAGSSGFATAEIHKENNPYRGIFYDLYVDDCENGSEKWKAMRDLLEIGVEATLERANQRLKQNDVGLRLYDLGFKYFNA